MTELEQVVEAVRQGLDNAENYGSAIVGISRSEAQALINAAQLAGPLQERCQLLGRALAAVWSLVGDEDQRAIMALLEAPAGAGKTLPALSLIQMLERKGAMGGIYEKR